MIDLLAFAIVAIALAMPGLISVIWDIPDINKSA